MNYYWSGARVGLAWMLELDWPSTWDKLMLTLIFIHLDSHSPFHTLCISIPQTYAWCHCKCSCDWFPIANYEFCTIQYKGAQLILEIHGKPIIYCVNELTLVLFNPLRWCKRGRSIVAVKACDHACMFLYHSLMRCIHIPHYMCTKQESKSAP